MGDEIRTEVNAVVFVVVGVVVGGVEAAGRRHRVCVRHDGKGTVHFVDVLVQGVVGS